jgi:hypothetical protein
MSIGIPQEQPPSNTDPALAEWLTRLVIEIGAYISNPKVVSVNDFIEGDDFTVQSPVGLDTPMQVKFGPAIRTPLNPFHIDALGTLHSNASKTYNITIDVNMARSTNPGFSRLMVYAELNGVLIITPTIQTLSSLNDLITNKIIRPVNMIKGDQFKVYLVREGAGTNDGELRPTTTAAGVPNIPSAFITVFEKVVTV